MWQKQDNKALVRRWFAILGQTCNLGVVGEIAAPDMLLEYSPHVPRNGHEDIKAFMADFREAFRDLNFWARPPSLPKATMSSASGKVVGCTAASP